MKLPAFSSLPASRRRKIDFCFKTLLCFAGGCLYAAALPPFNLTCLAAFCLVPLLFVLHRAGTKAAFFYGWVWGMGWALFAFRFLREIEAIVPFLIAPVLSLWPAVFAGAVPFLRSNTLDMEGTLPAKKQSAGKVLLYALELSVLFVLLEWTRSRLFPWNDFSVTLWKVPVLLQIAVWTGHYGVNFLVLLANTAWAALLIYRSKTVFCLLTGVILLAAAAGFYRLKNPPPVKTADFSPALIQGNLSQRRHATLEQAAEALEIYAGTTKALLDKGARPHLVIWPEGAVPIPFYTAYDLSRYPQTTAYGRLAALYQQTVKELCRSRQVPFLIGALDFDNSTGSTAPGATNSALLFDETGTLRTKYDKLHRVPFGEYIPFRRYLPGFLIRCIDMGRDLVPGKNANPIVLSEKFRAGTAVCYEGVFSYVIRHFARRGANVLIVLSNDAWYPRSSEPEQHLANAVLRAVETALPMIRCGNNGGSGVVMPDGSFRIIDPTGKSPRPELLRCRAAEVITVPVPLDPPRTFYTRYGEWFILLLALFAVYRLCAVSSRFHDRMKRLAEITGAAD
ncbi:MAG: apolipoprotein N-acyltransferase [Lentisphaeria bacterium]|nr:apolipoprotein N-acyltransferase [Lentisphaeria bacterium]